MGREENPRAEREMVRMRPLSLVNQKLIAGIIKRTLDPNSSKLINSS